MRTSLFAMLMLAVVGMASCGEPDQSGLIDAAEIDSAVVDPPPASTSTVIDLTSAAGRMQGGSFSLDFAIGHSLDQRGATGGAFTLDTRAALVP